MDKNFNNNNPLETIRNDLAEKESVYGPLKVLSANDAILSAKSMPDPVDLYDGIIFEGTMACIFADTGLGKSIFAVQIGEHIAMKQPVVYLDCELSDKQFEIRYRSDDNQDEYHKFPDNFYRLTIIPGEIESKNFEETILSSLVAIAERMKAKVLIIDNITYLCNQSEKSDIASTFMKRLKEIKDNGYTVIAIAHTPKLSPFRPICDCDLAGSRRLANFFDTIIAIGKSAKDPHLRYIKQVKGNRTTENKYDENSVLVCQITKEENALRLSTIGTAREREHLVTLTDKDEGVLESNVIKLSQMGLSYREISTEMGISKSSVGRILKDFEKSEQNEKGNSLL